jgi:hypothetical protein
MSPHRGGNWVRDDSHHKLRSGAQGCGLRAELPALLAPSSALPGADGVQAESRPLLWQLALGLRGPPTRFATGRELSGRRHVIRTASLQKCVRLSWLRASLCDSISLAVPSTAGSS